VLRNKEAKASGYEPKKGDIHVVDGGYYRVHIAQGSGRAYTVRAVFHTEAVWNGDELIEPAELEWEYPGIPMGKLSDATKATAEQAKAFSRLAGRCCFCSSRIDTPESTLAGYGPKCAANYGLPWGSTADRVGA
jgi:hypothetical protein